MKEFVKTEGQKDTANFAIQAMVALAIVGLVFYCAYHVAAGSLKADSAPRRRPSRCSLPWSTSVSPTTSGRSGRRTR